MSTPWPLVSAAAYEAHAGGPGEGATAALAAIFGKVYAARRPRRLLVLGVATGSALAHVDVRLTGRTVGVDPNLSFLAVARQRQQRLGGSLQLLCATAEEVELPAGSFDLVHASAVLEWTDLGTVVPKVAGWLAEGGAFTAVLHLPPTGGARGRAAPPADPTLREAVAAHRFVPPEELRARCAEAGLAERRAFVVQPPGGGRALFAGLYAPAAAR